MSSLKSDKFLYPDCWNDDVRMGVLFAPFRPKSVNPENYISKLNFWKNMIKKFCEYKGCAKFCKTELLLNFQRNEKSPYCIDHVLEDMYQNQEIKTVTQFNETIEDGWSIWALKTFVKKPIVWGIQKTIGSVGTSETQNIEYIFTNVLQDQASNLLNVLKRLDRQIISFNDIDLLDGTNLNSDGKKLCLRYLHYLKKIYVEYELRDGIKEINVIKVPKLDQIASPLTDLEWTLYNLENTQNTLDKCITDLENDIEKNQNLARDYVRKGNKILAKSCLKKKHLIEKNLEKRIIARDNIHSLITNLNEAQHNGFVLNAIKMGSDTLKSVLKEADLDLDNVDEIILEVKDTLDMHDEVQKTVSEPLVSDIDDSALEEELNEILSKSAEEEEREEEELVKVKEDKKDDKDLLEQLEKLNVGSSSPSSETENVGIPFT